jgi:hypothetical protein
MPLIYVHTLELGGHEVAALPAVQAMTKREKRTRLRGPPLVIRYVGQSRHGIEQRWGVAMSEAREGRGGRLGEAIRAYGEWRFGHTILEWMPWGNQSRVDERERYWIRFYDCMWPNGMNERPPPKKRNARSRERDALEKRVRLLLDDSDSSASNR